jgi:hypothetical protein
MKQLSNRKKVMLTLILSVEDNDTLTEAAKEVGLKKSEYLRAIIQGIGAGKKVANQIETGKDVNIELQGYGFSIPNNVMEQLMQSISQSLINGIQVNELEPKKNLRQKRMKPIAKAS